MAPKSVSVTVRYSKPGTQPPIYLAGSFSDPAWEPQEMQYTTTEGNEHEFYKELQVEEGQVYQYKFRIGNGDWWMLNEESATATDDAGNRNNVLSVPVSEEPKHDHPSATTASQSAAEMESTKPKAMEHEKAAAEETQTNGHTESKGDAELTKEHNVITPANTTTPTEEAKEEEAPAPKAIPYHLKENAEIRAGTPDSEVVNTHNVEDIKAAQSSDDALSPEYISTTEASLTPMVPSGTIEPASTPAVQSKSLETSAPTLIVEKVDDGLRHGDDFGSAATVAQKDAHLLRSQDAEPDQVVLRSESKTPELADNAYEVSESAALLDRDPPTPPISDEEAGRIGFRRMSSTPIPEVAKTAAEVADVAATLDEEVPAIHIDTAHADYEEDFIDSGASTPASQKAPRFAYECMSPDDTLPADARPTQRFDPLEPVRSPYDDPVAIDWNDPSIEIFPTERSAIIERLRRLSQRMPEDDSSGVEVVPPSPVVGPDGHPERQLPAPSPIFVAHEVSPSLDSITEENDELQETLVSMPHISKLSSTGAELPSPGLSKGINDTKANGAEKPVLKGKENHISVGTVELDGANGSEESMQENIKPAEVTEVVANSEESADEQIRPADVAEVAAKPEKQTDSVSSFIASQNKSIELPQGSGVAELTSRQEQSDEVTIPERISSKVQEVVQTPPAVEKTVKEQPQHAPSPATPFIVGNRQLGEDGEIQDIQTGDATPNITVQPATPGAAIAKTEFILKPLDEAKSSAIEEENGRAQIVSRKEGRAKSPQRPGTPSSMRSATREPKSRGFLKAFWQVLFVDWIGGIFRALCGGGRGSYTLMAMGVITVAVVAPALFRGLFGKSLPEEI